MYVHTQTDRQTHTYTHQHNIQEVPPKLCQTQGFSKCVIWVDVLYLLTVFKSYADAAITNEHSTVAANFVV